MGEVAKWVNALASARLDLCLQGFKPHSGLMNLCRAAQLLKVLVLYVTVCGYLQGKDPLRLFDRSRGYTWFQASSSS